MFKRIAVGFGAALVVGLAFGVIARLLMRLVTLSAGHEADFSWSGSFFIVMIFVLAMLPGALVAAFTLSKWRVLLPVMGALFLIIPAVGVGQVELGDTTGMTLWQAVGAIAAGLGIFALIGWAPHTTLRIVDELKS